MLSNMALKFMLLKLATQLNEFRIIPRNKKVYYIHKYIVQFLDSNVPKVLSGEVRWRLENIELKMNITTTTE